MKLSSKWWDRKDYLLPKYINLIVFSIPILPLFIIFVWHTELYFYSGSTLLGNGFFNIEAIKMYHIIMYTFISYMIFYYFYLLKFVENMLK